MAVFDGKSGLRSTFTTNFLYCKQRILELPSTLYSLVCFPPEDRSASVATVLSPTISSSDSDYSSSESSFAFSPLQAINTSAADQTLEPSQTLVFQTSEIMFSFGRKKKQEDIVITRIDSPKVTRERKSVDVDPASARSPRATRKERGDVNLHKSIYDSNTSSWQLRYQIDNQDYAKGAYGKVILATDKSNGQKVVIKKIPQTTPIRMINNEVRAGKFLGSHPNIAQLFQYIDRPDFHYLVFQYISGQDLFCYLEKISFAPRSETEARSIVTQICKALEHIHSHSIAHRDIKLENLLIDPSTGKVCVIDLGLCAFIEEGKLCRDWCGSDNYLAPEIVRRIPYNGYKADVFSTGVVLFALLFGVFPFENLRVNGASADPQRSLRPLKVRFPSDVKVSASAKELLCGMLEDDPEKRLSIADILKHEWIASGDAMTQPSQTVAGKDSPKFQLKASCEAVPAM